MYQHIHFHMCIIAPLHIIHSEHSLTTHHNLTQHTFIPINVMNVIQNNYPVFTLHFLFIDLVYMICFSIFYLKLLYTYWQILSRQLPRQSFLRESAYLLFASTSFYFGPNLSLQRNVKEINYVIYLQNLGENEDGKVSEQPLHLFL